MAMLLIVGPLFLKRGPALNRRSLSHLGYFFCLGAGFIILEIALIQKTSLLFDTPSITIAVVLASLILFSGIGSLVSNRSFQRGLMFRSTALMVCAYALALYFTLDTLTHLIIAWPMFAKGIVVAGLIMTAVPPDLLAAWAQGPLAMLLVLGVSVPMYVCATASTPIALALIYAGVSPGTALVFLLAGPASNFAGLALVGRELGWRTMAIYIGGISLSALAAGLVLDAIWPVIGGGQTVPAAVGEMHDATPLWLAVPSLLVLGIVSLKPLRRALSRRLDSLALNHG